MPVPNPKNMGLSPSMDLLGLGSDFLNQETETEEEKRKKLLRDKANLPKNYGDSTLSTASLSLLNMNGNQF